MLSNKAQSAAHAAAATLHNLTLCDTDPATLLLQLAARQQGLWSSQDAVVRHAQAFAASE